MAYTLVDIEVPRFEYDLRNNQATATRVCRLTPWEELDNCISDLGGSAIVTGQILLIQQPAKFPGKPHLWLHNIQVKPFHDCVGEEDSNDLPEDPTGAELTLLYRTPQVDEADQNRPDLPDVPDGTFLTVSRNMTVEFAAEAVQGLYWEAGKGGGEPFQAGDPHIGHRVPIDSNISGVLAVADLQITWHQVKSPPWRAINALQGCVNDAPFMGYKAEQVLFVGVRDEKQYQANGNVLYELTYQFNCRIPKFKAFALDPDTRDYLPIGIVSGGWNHFPRKGTLGVETSPYWQKVYRTSGSPSAPQTSTDLLFIPADFRKLFQPDHTSS